MKSTLGALLTLIGATIKVMHWPYGNTILIVGMGLAALAAVLPYVSENEDSKD
ncbi:MAG: hypothetical protein HOI49_07065 [Bacteroidetes bacterium]|nr:hypothetical protein [Bacteroidota bacterium]